MNEPPDCSFCGGLAVLHATSEAMYRGRDYGPVWACENFPACDSYVGCHKGGPMRGQPLGTLTDAEGRYWRNRAHAVFDPLWQGRSKNYRRRLYARMQQVMQLTPEEAHIGMFGPAACRRLIAMVEAGEFAESEVRA